MLNHFIHSHTQTIYWEIQYCSATCNSVVETSMHQTPNDYFNNTIVTLLNQTNFSKPNFTVCNAFALRVKYEIITTRGILVHDVFFTFICNSIIEASSGFSLKIYIYLYYSAVIIVFCT